MGNEASMCGCYDLDKEKAIAESDCFQEKPIVKAKYKNLNFNQYSQYSYGKSSRKYMKES